MTTMTPTRLAQMPRVNLLPPEIAAEAKFKRLQVLLGALLLALIALVVMVFLAVTNQISGAEDELTAAQAEGSTLAADVATYAEVPEVLAEVQTAQTNLSTAMAPEIRWSFYLNDLSLTIPNSTRIATMTAVNEAAAAQMAGELGTTAQVTPLGEVSIGSVTFSSRSTNFDAVAAWMQSLARQKGYVEPTVQSVTKSDEAETVGTIYNVESSTQLNTDAVSGRYLTIANGE